MELTRYLRLYRTFTVMNIRASMSFRSDFLIGLASTVMMQGAQVAALFLVMGKIPSLAGWSLDQLFLMFGLVTLARSLNHMFGDQLWRLGWLFIRTGDFDKYLLRPVNPLFHFVASRFCQDGIGYAFVGLAMIVKGSLGLHGIWTPLSVLCCVVAVLGGGLIFFAINLITASASFWMVDSLALMQGVFMTNEMAQYPVPIYGRIVQGLLTFVLPYGLISFYPVQALTGGHFGVLAWATPLAGLVILGVGILVWRAGVRHYGSTGS